MFFSRRWKRGKESADGGEEENEEGLALDG